MMMKKFIPMFLAALVVTPMATASGIEHRNFAEPQESIQPFVLEAIKSGGAEGILAGDAARFIHDKMGAATPLRVKVTRLAKYQQEGCARLNAQFKQENVTLPGESVARDREVNFQFNYCLDGRPPMSEGKEYVINSPFNKHSSSIQKNSTR